MRGTVSRRYRASLAVMISYPGQRRGRLVKNERLHVTRGPGEPRYKFSPAGGVLSIFALTFLFSATTDLPALIAWPPREE